MTVLLHMVQSEGLLYRSVGYKSLMNVRLNREEEEMEEFVYST